MAMNKKGFTAGFEKTATTVGQSVLGMKPGTAKNVHYGLEQAGLGTLGAIDLHNAYKAHKEGNKGERNKALLGAGALGGLMAATHIAHRMH